MTDHQPDIDALNRLPSAQLRDRLQACCAATVWVEDMLAGRPYKDAADLHARAQSHWPSLTEADWLAAFDAHPRIGDISSLKQKYANTSAAAGQEQSGAQEADEATLEQLKALNDQYLARFGFIFIVCATGKTATEMLDLLRQRIDNTRREELAIASREQAKITHLRLESML